VQHSLVEEIAHGRQRFFDLTPRPPRAARHRAGTDPHRRAQGRRLRIGVFAVLAIGAIARIRFFV
jgi:hypothetical protein